MFVVFIYCYVCIKNEQLWVHMTLNCDQNCKTKDSFALFDFDSCKRRTLIFLLFISVCVFERFSTIILLGWRLAESKNIGIDRVLEWRGKTVWI